MLVGVILLLGAFSGGLLVGQFLPEAGGELPVVSDWVPFSSAPTSEQQEATPSEYQELFEPFWEAWNIVHEQFVDQPVDDVALMQGAIRGMMEALGDEQTFYMEPRVYEN
jgi:carboxyl-terminal processing protease